MFGLVTRVLVAGWLLLGLSLAPSFLARSFLAPSFAQEDDGETESPVPVSAFVELPGRCEPDSARFDPSVEFSCEFTLLVDIAPEMIDYAAVIDDQDDWSECIVTAKQLRCGGVGGDYIDGPRSLSLTIVDEFHPVAAEFETAWPDDTQLFVSLPTDNPVTFPGYPIEVSSYPSGDVEGLFLNVRVRGSDRVVTSIELDPGSSTREGSNELQLDLDPGEYRMWTCVGPTPTDCAERSGGHGFQVIEPAVIELVGGHNRIEAERINVLFVGAGLDGADELVDAATLMLGLGGPVSIDGLGQPTDDPSSIVDVRFGPMAIEPLRSNREKFNFWVLPDDLASELALSFDGRFADRLDAFGLPNIQVTAIYDARLDGASDARGTTFFGRQTVPPVADLAFGGARVAIDRDAPLYAAETLAHEWGHSIFELRDEYYGFDGRDVAIGYPNCAADQQTGEAWWASRLGHVDPFVDEVLAARQAAGLEPEPRFSSLAELVRIEPTLGGCYGNFGEPTAFRPSEDSLMNSELPVFGSVNRDRIEIVLRRFSGRGPLEALEDVELDCASTGRRLRCTGTLHPRADPPTGRLEVAGVPCRFDVDIAPLSVECTGPVDGSQVEGGVITVTLGEETTEVPIRVLAPPTTIRPSTTTSTAQPVDEPTTVLAGPESLPSGEDGGARSAPILFGVGLVVVAAGVAVLIVNRRAS